MSSLTPYLPDDRCKVGTPFRVAYLCGEKGARRVDARLPEELAPFAHTFFDAIVDGRVDDIVSAYAATDATLVFLEGPRWQTVGFERISAGWRAFADAPLEIDGITWVDGPYGAVEDRIGWFAGTVELLVRTGDSTRSVRWRDTHVVARDADGAWRIVHEHVSQPVADPYGIGGDWAPT